MQVGLCSGVLDDKFQKKNGGARHVHLLDGFTRRPPPSLRPGRPRLFASWLQGVYP